MQVSVSIIVVVKLVLNWCIKMSKLQLTLSLFILVFLLSNQRPFAQDIGALDIKNGFKHFSFGQKKSSFINYIYESDLEEYYFYKDNTKDSTLFEYDWSKLILHFNVRDELDQVIVFFQSDIEEQKYRDILGKLTVVFGTPTYTANRLSLVAQNMINKSDDQDTGPSALHQWQGNKINMDLVLYDEASYLPKIFCDNCILSISIWNHQMKNKILKDDF